MTERGRGTSCRVFPRCSILWQCWHRQMCAAWGCCGAGRFPSPSLCRSMQWGSKRVWSRFCLPSAGLHLFGQSSLCHSLLSEGFFFFPPSISWLWLQGSVSLVLGRGGFGCSWHGGDPVAIQMVPVNTVFWRKPPSGAAALGFLPSPLLHQEIHVFRL